jgi:chemotaxis protein methyltransferase CheR
MPSPASIMEIDPGNYRFLQEHVYSQVGIVLEEDKRYLFESRLAPIVRKLGLASINHLCALMQSSGHPELCLQVVEAMTTNETYFFRDPSHYDAIRNVLLPRLMQDRLYLKKVRFWSAASSTGQEAYSLAMLLIEAGMCDWNIEIVGTDFSSQVVERARSGIYHQIEVNRGLPATLLVKYFTRLGTEWQLCDRVRRMVRFETIDLRKSLRVLGSFDLVFCRNVMIYFDAQTKLKILKELHGTLLRGGWLLLGGAETAPDIGGAFERQSIGNAAVYVAR